MWFQRASDVVRKLLYGDVDLGIVGARVGSFAGTVGKGRAVYAVLQSLSLTRGIIG